MKKFFSALLISSIPTFALAASATLDATKKLELKFENLSGVNISKLELSPRFSCWTIKPQGWGDADTVSNVANTLFQVSSVDGTSASIQHMNSISIEAPKKERITNRQGCNALVNLTAMTPYGREINFSAPLAIAKTSRNKVNLTKEFSSEVEGNYVFKLVNDGTAWDHETNGRMNVCKIALYKNVKGELKEIAKSYDFQVDRCKI